MCGLRIHIQYEYLVPRDDGEQGHLSVITQNSRPWLMGTWFKGRDISALEIYLLLRWVYTGLDIYLSVTS